MPGETKFLPRKKKNNITNSHWYCSNTFCFIIYGMYRGKYNYKVLSYKLKYDDLPDAFDGYKIVQISDIHSGSFDNQKKYNMV